LTAGAGAGAGSRTSAVVVNYNAREHLLRCLASLRREGIVDVVVADNGSTDGSEPAVRAADPEATYVPTGANLGYGGGCNRGAARTDAARPYLLCLNPDAHLEPGALEALVAVLDARADVGIVGPQIVDPHGTVYPSVRTFPNLVDSVGHAFLGLVWGSNPFTRRYRMLGYDHSQAGDVEWVSGSCFLIRRSAWDAIGGFDEGYFMYAEDSDLCWRAARAGWKVAFEPAAVAVHVQGVSTDRHPYRMIAAHHRAIFRFASRTTTGPTRALLPLMALGLAVRTPLAWLHRALAGTRKPRSVH
jgi:N-acetylglucosaminyl-diphospho-decaprenol L-rhamnosyltransferase